ncbi:FecR family protein [Pedobacter sp.]
MEEKQDNIEELFVRYWDGYADEAEKAALLDWLEQSEENSKLFSQTHDIWLASSTDAMSQKTEQALDQFKLRVFNSELDKVKKASFIERSLKIAASVAIIFSLGYYFLSNNLMNRQLLVINQVIMPEGSKGKVALPDGSLVWLKSNSRVVYPETFTGGRREVEVFGEAYFEVVHDKDNPFVVKADKVNVTVLGTKFNVQNYKEKENIVVALLEGKVGLSSDALSKEQILLPNQKFVFNKKQLTAKLSAVKAVASVSWINERLAFENKSLSEIIPYLEAWYGVEIVCEKAIAEQTRLTFTIRNDTLNDTMKSIAYVSSLQFEQKNDIIYIHK